MGRKCIGERPMTPRERAAASQQRLIENGGTIISMRVSPDLAYAIKDIQRNTKIIAKTKAIEYAIFAIADQLNQEEDESYE